MRPGGFNLFDVIKRNALLYPDRDCIIFEDRRLSFKQFKKECDQIAAGLLKAGIKKGDRLAIIAQNSDKYGILYGAAAKMGAILVPINWRFQQEEIKYVLNDCAPKRVFIGQEYLESVAKAVEKLDFIEGCYALDKEEVDGRFRPFGELYLNKNLDQESEILPDSGFVIIYTAAVLGKPRGALLSQANIVYSNMQIMYHYGLNEEDCGVCILPLFHIGGISIFMAVMHAGGKNVIMERFDPDRTLKLIDEEKGTVLYHFPPILRTLVDKYEMVGRAYNLSSLRHVGGLDQQKNLLAFRKIVPNAKLWTGFGQTEANPVTAGLMGEKPGSAGRPTCLSKVAILDDYDHEVPEGTVGEICIQSPAVFLGYWGQDDETAHTFRSGWHHTGDMGRFDNDGYLWYVKRKAQKELIKPGGENVYPAEVERVIIEHKKVVEVSVIGVPDDQWGEAVKAICVLKHGETMDPQEMIDFVGTKIARYKKPKYVVFVGSLPKTADGEIDREQVKSDHGGKY
jgi:long-chain acyl-CoA synthetase